MKKLSYKIISFFLLIVVFVGAFGFYGCSPSESTEESKKVYAEYEGGKTHKFDVSRTSRYIISSGVTDYKVVISSNASEAVRFAVDELNYFIELATGITFPVILDEGLSVNSSSKYIVIGKNKLSDDANMTYDFATLRNDGYKIKTVGDTVYMGGYSANGDLFAVYKFLEYAIDYEYYTVITANYKKTKSVYLYNFDVLDVPDFDQRIVGTTGWQSGHTKETTIKRSLNDTSNEALLHPSQLIPLGYGHFHNTGFWLPYATYGAEHPKWFATNATDETMSEFCYTAHGDAAEYEAMQNELIKRIVLACQLCPETTNINISINDHGVKCNCAACRNDPFFKATGGYSGMVIKFMNDLEAKLNSYMKTNNDGLPRDRVMTIQFFAYSFCLEPPIQRDSMGNYLKDAEGNYMLFSPEYKCNENLRVWFAALESAISGNPNVSNYEPYLAWKTVANNIDFWLYGCNFQYKMTPFLGINSFVDNVRAFAKDGNTGLIQYEQEDSPIGSGFYKLQGYICSKITWDINENVSDLMEEYFKNVFGPAAKTMRKYYNELTAYLTTMIDLDLFDGGVYAPGYNENVFTQEVCERWIKYCDDALAQVEKISISDPVRYVKYRDEIINESIFPRFYLLRLHDGNFSDEQKKELKTAFLNDIDRISDYAEIGWKRWDGAMRVGDYIQKWRNEI